LREVCSQASRLLYFKESFKAGIYSVFCLQNAEFCETIEKKQPAGRR
jgi:hypothetical protein